MDRRRFLLTSLAGVLVEPLAPAAQPAAKVTRIGYLLRDNDRSAATSNLRETFLQALRDLGYIEGQNLVMEYRSAEGKIERLPALAAELVALKVDVIMAPSTVAALAAKQTTRTLPIVSMAIPAGSGLVTSLAQPGGNVTGLAFFSPELVAKCLEQFKQAVPRVSRVAALWQPGGQGERPETEQDMLARAEVAARALGIGLQQVAARTPADFAGAFAEMTRSGAGAVTVLPSNMFLNERSRLVDLAAKSRLPAVYPWREFVDAGGLMSYGLNVADLFRRAAAFVDRILRGAKPADLPVEQPTKFELVINLKTAKALGLTIPPSVLARADQVIE
jgi:ABC-type uncharacterized transport system substrate-binding protein